jgi:molybdopterin/thiamine biosynthesis adenylyltransferase
MKRSELVENLIKEGMSEKTLVNFTDKQLSNLHERMVISADKLKSDPILKAIANDPNT